MKSLNKEIILAFSQLMAVVLFALPSYAKLEPINHPAIDYESVSEVLENEAEKISAKYKGNAFLFLDCKVEYCDKLDFVKNDFEECLFENGIHIVPLHDSPLGKYVDKLTEMVNKSGLYEEFIAMGHRKKCKIVIELRFYEVGEQLKIKAYTFDMEYFEKYKNKKSKDENKEKESGQALMLNHLTAPVYTNSFLGNVLANSLFSASGIRVWTRKIDVGVFAEYIHYDLNGSNNGYGGGGEFWYKLAGPIGIGSRLSFNYLPQDESFESETYKEKTTAYLAAIKPGIRIGNFGDRASFFVMFYGAMYFSDEELSITETEIRQGIFSRDESSSVYKSAKKTSFKGFGSQVGARFPIATDAAKHRVLFISLSGGYDVAEELSVACVNAGILYCISF